MTTARPLTGAFAIALAIAFNIPYSILAATYDYPAVLRRSAGEALALFTQGGPHLVLTWYAFMLAALAIIPLAFALSITPERLTKVPARAIGAALAGALAGITQAIGLSRWVFVVPGLARTHAGDDDVARLAAERTFDVLNQYGGVAIGEHLGQLLTALFVILLSSIQWSEGRSVTALIGIATAASIAAGTGEGLAIALGQSGEMFSLATIAGFLGLTLWLIATGLGLFFGRKT
ncbi:MAG: DUF4386 domain-containing protein [Alphaproteobacteria bacterium]|nr:DUF4386 domain-containing protein [Alphaproteobacteria bacterium]